MRPIRVWGKAYGPYSDIEWAVPEGVTAILGKNDGEGINSNGAGKTKLLELLPIALFGPSMPWSEYLTTGGTEATCEVGLEFEHGGDSYRIRRTFTAKGRGKTTLDLERQVAAPPPLGDPDPSAPAWTWEPLSRESQGETQKEIERLLGLTETTFEHSVFAKQSGRHFADPDLAPRERKEILAEALGLGMWDVLLERARTDLKAVELKLTTLKGSLSAWEAQLEAGPVAERELAELTARVAALQEQQTAAVAAQERFQTEYETARAARAALSEAAGRVDARRTILAGFTAKIDAAQRAKEAADALNPQIVELDSLAREIPALEEQVDVLKGAGQERERVLADRASLLEQAQRARLQGQEFHAQALALDARIASVRARLETPPGDCDRCGQPVAGDARETMLAALRADLEILETERRNTVTVADARTLEADAHDARARQIVVPAEPDTARLAESVQKLGAARTAQITSEGLRARLGAAHEALAAISDDSFYPEQQAAEQALQEAEATLGELEAQVVSEEAAAILARDALGAKLLVDEKTRELDQARVLLGGAEQRVRTIADLAARSKDALAERARLERRAGVLGELVRAYGRDGIPALIMESTAIPQIEREAQRILETLGVPFRVELRTQAVLKSSADRLKDTLEVVVHEPNGERRYETYSGGERARINVALRIALARLLAHRRGASMEVFALDEVEHLDAAGVARLAELLRELQREVPVVLFISHVDTLVEAFDQVVTVVREDGRSRLEVAA